MRCNHTPRVISLDTLVEAARAYMRNDTVHPLLRMSAEESELDDRLAPAQPKRSTGRSRVPLLGYQTKVAELSGLLSAADRANGDHGRAFCRQSSIRCKVYLFLSPLEYRPLHLHRP